MTKHTDISHLTDSGVSGNAQTSAREIRLLAEAAAVAIKKRYEPHSKIFIGEGHIVTLLEPLISECQGLASRVEQLKEALRLAEGQLWHPSRGNDGENRYECAGDGICPACTAERALAGKKEK